MNDSVALKLHRRVDLTELEISIRHPMDAGDASQQNSAPTRPPSFLQSMVIQVNEKTLVEGQLSASISKNPTFVFSFSGIRTGDRFTVSCTDNNGKQFKNAIDAKI